MTTSSTQIPTPAAFITEYSEHLPLKVRWLINICLVELRIQAANVISGAAIISLPIGTDDITAEETARAFRRRGWSVMVDRDPRTDYPRLTFRTSDNVAVGWSTDPSH